ncbi:hypothetical protein [Macrococcus sp. DPC7161]|uniref:hypothetical protein n=1 Tax=Macrococcus sp. DPC7161 TaxID=2507060 RepID=UPI00100AE0EA|nr:hypothetical protein [Macrococcus sp. DPC7161]RXK19089.1 hypothetical protein ER639_01890 [Macrococcus sp. DPC7161]
MLGKVLGNFTDRLNEALSYVADDLYHTTDKERFDELASDKNATGEVLVKALTLAELKSLAEKHNIEVPSKIKRDDLEGLIEGELYGDVE